MMFVSLLGRRSRCVVLVASFCNLRVTFVSSDRFVSPIMIHLTNSDTSLRSSFNTKTQNRQSISGRLRSASDLEDTGVISREQKAILKDLIIAGDNTVQSAIDKYEAGDTSALEDMIKSGALLVRPTDVDLLSDLDLDFLNVHVDDEEGEEGHHHDGMMFGNIDDLGGGGHGSSNYVDGVVGGYGRQSPGGGTLGSSMNDGIGELEFNEDLTNSAVTVGSSSINNLPSSYYASMMRQHKARGNSVDDIDVHRMRANSLALPGILLDGAHPDDSQISFGRWMDKELMGSSSLAQHAIPLKGGTATMQQRRHAQFSSECDMLMASKLMRQGEKPKASTKDRTKKLSPTRKEKKELSPTRNEKKELPPTRKEKKELSPTRKEKKEPRERKSQSKMKDMMEGISTANNAGASSAAGGDEEEESKEVQSGLGRPRSMSDPNLTVRLDDFGLLHVNGPEGWVGAYSPDSRHLRVSRFLEKRNQRVWVKKVKYDVRKVSSCNWHKLFLRSLPLPIPLIIISSVDRGFFGYTPFNTYAPLSEFRR